MSNTNLSYLYPEFWASGFDSLDIGSYGLQNQVNRDVETAIAKAGDTVNVPISPDFGDAASWTPGSTITPSGTTQTMATVTLDQSKQQARGFTDAELSLSQYNLIESYATPMAKSILRAVNASIYGEMIKSPYYVDATAGVAGSHVADAETALSNNEVGYIGRKFVCSPSVMGALRKDSAFYSNAISNDDMIQSGILAKRYGFDISENNIISKYTPADLVGAVDKVGGYAAGTTTIVVDGFNDDAKLIKAGDIFSYGAGATGYYTVQSTTLTGGDTTGITFLPALDAAIADDAVITVKATQSALAFVPSAVAFASRAYGAMGKPGVNSTIVNVQGLPVRISTWTDSSTLNLNVAMDILYGVKIVNDKRIIKVLEDI
jgi:hypothetical protein